jgi:hypothetical protein
MPWTPNKPDGSTPTAVLLRWLWERVQILDNIRGSSSVRVSRSTRGITLYANPPGSSSQAQPVQTLTITQEHDDYVLCGSVPVAKPLLLRRSAYQTSGTWTDGAAATPATTAVNNYYPGNLFTLTWTAFGQRTAKNSFGSVYNQYISRAYAPGETIEAFTPSGGTGAMWTPPATPSTPNPMPQPIMLQDANVDARQWCTLVTDCIQGVIQSLLYSGPPPFAIAIPPAPPI